MKLLTIGNSLSNDAMFYFPAMVESAGRKLTYFGANIGGLSLEQHATNLNDHDTMPEGIVQRYPNEFYPPRPGFGAASGGATLRQALAAEQWDVVTLQQVSGLSFRSESFEPYCTTLIEAIRQYAPGARIYGYQTWAYREDFPDFAALGLTQDSMYGLIRDAFAKLAADHSLGTIPAGWAFQQARTTPPWQFRFPDPAYDYASPHPATVPEQPGSLNIGWYIGEVPAEPGSSEAPKKQLMLDFKHANPAGKYLAASVFFETIFEQTAEDITFIPDGLTAEQAASLRRIAHEACLGFENRNVAAV